MFWWKWLDNLDTWFAGLEAEAEAMFSKAIEAVRWTWGEMTLVSVLLILVVISISGLTLVTFCDRKRYMSRSYWRGFEDGKKR